MTCLFISLLTLSLSSADKYSRNDLDTLWETYSPFTSNLTLLKHLLDEFEFSNDTQSKLSEFWLLGLPVQPTNSYKDSDYMKNSKFKRNLDLAVYYLKKSLLTNKDSSFFLNLISQSSLLFEGFDAYVPIRGTSQESLKYYTDKGLFLKSPLSIVSTLHQFQKCSKIQKIPNFLKENSTLFMINPKKSYICSYTCRDLAYLALTPATESLKFIQRTNREHFIVPFIGKEDSLTATRLNNVLKIYERYINYSSSDIITYVKYYLQGYRILGLQPEIESGLKILEKSAALGNIKAHEMLGEVYSDGKYVQKNITKALSHLNHSILKGSIRALSILGQIYLYGNNVNKDEKLGLKFLEKAEELGDYSSYKVLGEYYFLTKQLVKSLRYLQISVSLGSLSGMYYYGISLLQLASSFSDFEEALDYFKQILIEGSLSKYLENGYFMFIYEDYEGAFLNFLVSAALGEDIAFLNLAYMFEKDLVPDRFRCKKGKEFCAGWFYYLAVKDAKNLHALGKIVAKGNAQFEGNYLEAKEYFQQANELPESLYEIASMYEYGLGVSQNLTKAGEIYKGIVENAENEVFDVHAKYPAYIAGLRIRMKKNEAFSGFLNRLFYW